MKKSLIIGFASAFFLVCSNSFADAQTPGSATAASAKTQTTSHKSSLLFVLAAPEGKISAQGQETTLTLKPIQHVMYFSDRPNRVSGGMPVQKFLASWKNGGNNSFQNDAPNAALIAALDSDKVTDNYHNDSFIVLSKPQYDAKSNALSFSVAPLDKRTTIKVESLKETVLFVDNFGCNYNSLGGNDPFDCG